MQRVMIAGLAPEGLERAQDSLEELRGLVEALGARVELELIQNKKLPQGSSYFGKGKIEEIILLCQEKEINLIVVDDELSGSHLRNLADLIEVPIMDRTTLILDIFAQRSRTKLAQYQVEMAQLRYNRTHLVGVGKFLSKQGAGIGTRGPGETKLELDRRKIDERIAELKHRIEDQKGVLATQRKNRLDKPLPVLSLVGYTNAGKSSLMNWFINNFQAPGEEVFVEDMLFATLDTFVRKIKLEEGMEFFLVDTVGFVRRLPELLVDAFQSTLEELVYSDLILHILDGSREDVLDQEEATSQVLSKIGAGDIPRLEILNKLDLGQNLMAQGISLSVKTGENMDLLIEQIKEKLFPRAHLVSFLFDYTQGSALSSFLEEIQPLEQEYREEGTWLLARIDDRKLDQYREYIDEINKEK